MRIVLASLLFLVLGGCGESTTTDATIPVPEVDSSLDPPPEGQGFQLSIEAVAPAASETWICEVYKMPNETIANVSWVEVKQNTGTHHLTLSTLGLTANPDLQVGRYNCDELYGDNSLMEDQIMFFGNQGSPEDVMHLPEGVAATLPPNLTIIHEIHYVNSSEEDVQLYSRLNAWTIPQAEVTSGIWGGSVRDETIAIPAASEHTEWSRCVFNRDVEVLFLASHTHELGTEFTVAPFDGTTTGDVMYRNTDWHIPLITQYDPPLVVPAGTGFEWACSWKNPRDEPVAYGPNSTDEMCNLAVVHTPFDITAACEVVETSDGALWRP